MNKVRHHTEESKKKMSLAHKGKCLSEEHKRKISESLKGRKGHPIDEETRMKISNTLKGRSLSKQNKENISKALKGRKFSEEHKKNLRKVMATEEYKRNHHLGCVRAQNNPSVKNKVDMARANRMLSKNPSDIELKIMKQLDDNDVEYIFQHFIFSRKYIRGFTFDFYLPYLNIMIEADGDYWHTLPSSVTNDLEKDAYCKFRKFNLVRIKGSTILKNNFNIMDFIKENKQ
mgnify:CR=1 FL=1